MMETHQHCSISQRHQHHHMAEAEAKEPTEEDLQELGDLSLDSDIDYSSIQVDSSVVRCDDDDDDDQFS